MGNDMVVMIGLLHYQFIYRQFSFIHVLVFWVMTPYGDVMGCQRFHGLFCFHLQCGDTWIFIAVKILSHIFLLLLAKPW